MADINIDGVVTWLKNWFYDKTEVTQELNAKVNVAQGSGEANKVLATDSGGNVTTEAKNNHSHGSVTSDGKIGSTSGKIITTGTDGSLQASDSITKSLISDFSHSHGNITNDGKVGTNANYFVYTTTSGAVTSKQKIGNINTDGKIGSTANLPLITTTNGVVTTGSFGTTANTFCQGNDSRLSDARTPTAHNQATSTITNSEAYNNIKSGESSTLTLTSQKLINDAINTKIGQLSQIKALEMVSTLPTASASTMGVLYVINESNKINFYYTENTGTSASPVYAWHKMDTDILDELIVNWSDVQNKPSEFTPSSHTHGNLQNDGTILNANGTLNVGGIVATDNTTGQLVGYNTLQSFRIKDPYAHSNIGSSADDTQQTINGLIDTALGTKITKSSSATGLLRDDGTVDTTTYLSSLPSHNHNTSLLSDTGDLKILVGNNNVANLGYWLNSNMGYKTDDVDWSYSSNGFTNGVKLVSKSDNANGRITLHLKS